MNLERRIEELAGIKVGAQLTGAEIPLFDQLKKKRIDIALELIPPALRDEFNNVVFPDRNLKWYAQALFRNRELHSMAISDFLTAHMKASLAAAGFGQKLAARGIRVEDILKRMVMD